MKCFTPTNFLAFVIFILCLEAWRYGEADIDMAPMEKAEKEALYSVIQGFVGSWWNGSDLYPDPCGWTPIQVLFSLFIFCSCSIFFSSSQKSQDQFFFFPDHGQKESRVVIYILGYRFLIII